MLSECGKFTSEAKLIFPVRSLASVSLWKTYSSHTPFHFDYFAVDLNEEYSALFGGVLKEQRDFVHQCLHSILALYRNNENKPTSVILIGHSMVCNFIKLTFMWCMCAMNMFFSSRKMSLFGGMYDI